MGKLGDDLWHKRLPDWEPFDKITLEIVPRFKTSGLSGDEWRQHTQVTFWHKGVAVFEDGLTTMDTALRYLGYLISQQTCPIPESVIAAENDTCDQPSCPLLATKRFRIKELFSERGEKLDPTDQHLAYYRQFCDTHAHRGDCSREDSDDNYEAIP